MRSRNLGAADIAGKQEDPAAAREKAPSPREMQRIGRQRKEMPPFWQEATEVRSSFVSKAFFFHVMQHF